MKQLLVIAAAALTSWGCSDESDYNTKQARISDEIQVSAAIATVEPGTRTSIDSTGKASWANGDSLGLFSPQAKLAAVNVKFTTSGQPSTPAWTPASSIYWSDASTSHTFLAYAPYASANTASSAIKLPSLSSQTGTVNPVQDFLISNNYGSTGLTRPENSSVGLTFTHAFALIQFQVTINSSIASGTTLTSFTLAGATGDNLLTADNNSTIALSTGAITNSTTTNTITITPPTPPVLSATAANLFVIILPGTHVPTLQITLNEGGTTVNVPVANISSTNYLAGSKYVYTVNISRTAISISNPTITDWNSVASGSIGGGI